MNWRSSWARSKAEPSKKPSRLLKNALRNKSPEPCSKLNIQPQGRKGTRRKRNGLSPGSLASFAVEYLYYCCWSLGYLAKGDTGKLAFGASVAGGVASSTVASVDSLS